MRTMKAAAQALGVDGNTLREWIRDAGAADRLERDPVDARLRYVPDELLSELAAAHRRRLVYGLVQASPDPAEASSDGAGLAAEVAALRRRVESLERAMLNRAPALPSAKSDGRNGASGYLDVRPPKAPESPPTRTYTPRQRPWQPGDVLPDPFANLSDRGRWLELHGIPLDTSRNTSGHWGACPMGPPAAILAWVIAFQAANWRTKARGRELHRCTADPLCPCRELLPASLPA